MKFPVRLSENLNEFNAVSSVTTWDNATTSFEFEEPSEISEIPNELEWATEHIEMLRDINLRKII